MTHKLQSATYSQLITPTAAATTALTANLDTADADYATILVSIGVEANTDATGVVLALTESDDTVVSNFATFDSDFARTVTGNSAAAVCVPSHVDLKGRKRYLRITATPDTTTNGAVTLSACAALQKSVMSGTITDYGTSAAVG